MVDGTWRCKRGGPFTVTRKSNKFPNKDDRVYTLKKAGKTLLVSRRYVERLIKQQNCKK